MTKDAALARLLSDTINDDRYPLLARIRAFEEDPRQDPAGAVTCTTAAPIRHRETHRAYKKSHKASLGKAGFRQQETWRVAGIGRPSGTKFEGGAEASCTP
jgi:hypothetical protein